MDPDSDGDFFGLGDTTPEAERVGGLIVPPRARVLYDARGEVLWDELVLLEADFRREGRPTVLFDDSAEDDKPASRQGRP